MQPDTKPPRGNMSGGRYAQLEEALSETESTDDILYLLRTHLFNVYGVERASIFLVDSLKMQLVSWLILPGESLRKIRIAIDKTSIAGYAASTREVVFIQDPYDTEELKAIDPELKFDSSWDTQTGYQTRQILAAPMMVERTLLGVIQLMNKRGQQGFTDQDKGFIRNLATTIGTALLRLQNK